MNTTLLILITAPLFVASGVILTAFTAYTFVHWNSLSKVYARIKRYSFSLRLAWIIETMVSAGASKVAQRKLLCKTISQYCIANMETFKDALNTMGVKYDITAQPSHYATTRSPLDSHGNQRTVFITIIDTDRCFGIGFLIMVSYLLIKELYTSTFNHAPINIVFCTACIVKDGEYHECSIGTNFTFTGDTNLYSYYTHFYEGVNKLNQNTYDVYTIDSFVTRLYPVLAQSHKIPDLGERHSF
jgi:hypothetical protein